MFRIIFVSFLFNSARFCYWYWRGEEMILTGWKWATNWQWIDQSNCKSFCNLYFIGCNNLFRKNPLYCKFRYYDMMHTWILIPTTLQKYTHAKLSKSKNHLFVLGKVRKNETKSFSNKECRLHNKNLDLDSDLDW